MSSPFLSDMYPKRLLSKLPEANCFEIELWISREFLTKSSRKELLMSSPLRMAWIFSIFELTSYPILSSDIRFQYPGMKMNL